MTQYTLPRIYSFVVQRGDDPDVFTRTIWWRSYYAGGYFERSTVVTGSAEDITTANLAAEQTTVKNYIEANLDAEVLESTPLSDLSGL